MASRKPVIDVDAFEAAKPPLDRRVSSTPILISDDEVEILEVAAKLSRVTRTPRSISIDSDIQVIGRRSPPPAFVDLVSDDERASKPIPSSSKRKQMSRAVSKVSTRKAIYQGPESSIRQDTPVKVKNERVRLKSESDAEEEDVYEHTTILAPFDSGDLPARHDRLEAPTEVETLIEPLPTRKRRYVDISPSTSTPTSRPPGYYLWDFLREIKVLPHSRPRPRFLSKHPRLGEALDIDHYTMSYQFRRAGGSVHEILQHNGRVVVGSSTAGGDEIRAGTLISWCKVNMREDETLFVKHYSVRSIAYDPVSNILASSGADSKLRTWQFNGSDDEPYSARQPMQYDDRSRTASPHQIVFKPRTSILAVGEQRLTIQDLSVEDARRHTFDLVENKRRTDHVTGSIAWGFGATSSFILALSEPCAKNKTRDGSHHAFDAEALRTAFKFDAAEAGDALCVDPTGDTAAVVTTNGVDFFLRIYDIRNRNGVASQTLSLEPFASKGEEEPEVNSMMFSPDSIYLALGRYDNCTHVYDCRMLKRRGMLDRGVLHNFKHSNLRLSSNSKDEFYGVVGAQWIQSRSSRLGLMTGGNDGCIRLWDPLHATEEGTIVAQADSDVAHFTLGDRFNGEHELVVGDSDGTVYILDGLADM
ncbi:WD40-repeat-containing domain protein [Mycena haematopus]|nr:WD40-repeat-containing domain protein [Mycena haematopus]